jgi:hypothetical protein
MTTLHTGLAGLRFVLVCAICAKWLALCGGDGSEYVSCSSPMTSPEEAGSSMLTLIPKSAGAFPQVAQ